MLVETGVSAETVHVIHSGADVRSFEQANRSLERSRLGYSDAEVVFCYIGSFRYFHGLDDVIEAARQAASSSALARFLMVGDGPRRAEVEQQVRQAGLADQFHFTGAVAHERIPALLAASDVCLSVYPTGQRMYFCPLKLLEYLAAGKAVLASRVGVQEEILTHGEDAWLVPLGDVAALSQAMLHLAGQSALRELLGRQAVRLVREQLTWEHVVERIERLLTLPAP